jgi:hypothetical protein
VTRAWTLGTPAGYEEIIRIPGNSKAPGGYAFPTREEAEEYVRTHEDASAYAPYAIELSGAYESNVTRSYKEAAWARHLWHRDGGTGYMEACGVCKPLARWPDLDHDLLLRPAPFVNPDEEDSP